MAELFTDNKHKDPDKRTLIDTKEPEPGREKLKKSLRSFLQNFKIHKSPGQKAPFKANPKIIFGILAFICLVLIILTAVSEKFAAPFKTAASLLIIPSQTGINSVGKWASDRIYDLKSREALAEENNQLRKEIDELTSEINSLRIRQEDQDRLMELLELKEIYADYETTAAQVVSRDSSGWFSKFTVNKGSLDGIQQNMNVVYKGGLVGVVSDVGLNYATVRSIIDDDSSISAMFSRTHELCVVEGGLQLMKDGKMRFYDASESADIQTGDYIVTSQISSIYHPGLIIGYVYDSAVDGSQLTKSGFLIPAVEFDNLNEVLIITELKEITD